MAYIALDSEMPIVVLHSHGFCDFHCWPYIFVDSELFIVVLLIIAVDSVIFIVVIHSHGF